MSNLGQEDQQVTLEKNNLLLTNVDVLNNPIVKLQIEELIESNNQLKELVQTQRKTFQEQLLNQAIKGVNFRERLEQGILTEGTYYSFEEHE